METEKSKEIIEKLEIPLKDESDSNFNNTLNLTELINIPNIHNKINSLSYEDKIVFMSDVLLANDDDIIESNKSFFLLYKDLLIDISNKA